MSFFESCLNSNHLIARLDLYVHPEFAVWSTSCPGVHSSRKSYETLETYGDTILKLASTILAFYSTPTDNKSDEKRMNNYRDVFITNLNLYRLGEKINLRRYIRNSDPDFKNWDPAFSVSSLNGEE